MHKAQVEKEKYWQRKAEKEKEKDTLHICEKIKSCKYGIRVGAVDMCDYMAQEGKRRPCPAGQCTEYKMVKGGAV